ncbi:MAG: hypothetical protein IIY16_04415 [Oscillospiraceae bacterium]|nr:hypothetical protein [Oscillospiraceae bacterium]
MTPFLTPSYRVKMVNVAILAILAIQKNQQEKEKTESTRKSRKRGHFAIPASAHFPLFSIILHRFFFVLLIFRTDFNIKNRRIFDVVTPLLTPPHQKKRAFCPLFSIIL